MSGGDEPKPATEIFNAHMPLIWRIAIVPLLIVMVLCLPIILPLLAFTEGRQQRQRQAAAARTHCQGCGAILGEAALARADEHTRERFANFRRDHPGWRPRMVRRIWAICTACGTRYDYDTKARLFTRLPPEHPG